MLPKFVRIAVLLCLLPATLGVARQLSPKWEPFQGTDGISLNDSEVLTVVENCKALAKHSEIEPPFSGQRACARPLIRKQFMRPV